MPYDHRRFLELENEHLRLAVLHGGGHIASCELKSRGVNPLWDPPWRTIEPSQFDTGIHPEFGEDVDNRLLAGIMGHNLCLDFFGPPSDDEAAAGHTVHGEAPVVDWDLQRSGGRISAEAELPRAGLTIRREITLSPDAHGAVVEETIENLQGLDRPIGWQQHATLGPPFLDPGKTVFHAPAGHSKVFDGPFAPNACDRCDPGSEFAWPHGPTRAGDATDMRVMAPDAGTGSFTTHLVNAGEDQAYFTAFHPDLQMVTGYIWRREDFPWIGIWEENRSRHHTPWNGETIARGMEFGTCPFPESRRDAVRRHALFGEPTYRWLPARGTLSARYCLFVAEAEQAWEWVRWKGGVIEAPGGRKLVAG